MADASGGGERTEKATPQRMKKLRKDGSLTKSQDLSAWLVVGAAAVMLPVVAGRARDAGIGQFQQVRQAIADPTPARAVQALESGLGTILASLTPLLIAVVLAAIIGNVTQGGLHIATKKLKPSFKHLNIFKGVKRAFGAQALWQGVKAVLKTAVIGLVLYVSVKGLVPMLMTAGGLSLTSLIDASATGTTRLLRFAVIAGLVLAAADVFVIIRRNRKQTRMSKKEISDEHKQTEGDPLIKGQIRARQLAVSRNRMLAAVADADVVVVNPTHVAVALKYTPGRGAPRVVATGRGALAAKIRERATGARVPMVQNIALARAIYAACKVDDEIPEELYTAVAQVLAFVMALRRRGASAGQHSMTATSPIPKPQTSAERARRRRAARKQARRTAQPTEAR